MEATAFTIELRAGGVAADLNGNRSEKMEEELRTEVKNEKHPIRRIESILTKCRDS